MRRDWLRPRWYVTSMGPWVAEGAYPESFTRVPDDEPDPVCSRCGLDLLDSQFYDIPEGVFCDPCKEIVVPYVAPAPWVRAFRKAVVWPVSERYDALYWRYCERFGKRVVQ